MVVTKRIGTKRLVTKNCIYRVTIPKRKALLRAVKSCHLEKNRVSAQNTRKRKKLYIDLLEAKVELLEAKVVLTSIE